MRAAVLRLLAIADRPEDGEDERVRKRVGVIAGYLTVVAPLSAPLQAQGRPLAIVLGVGLSLLAIGDIILLARTRAFERYIVILLAGGTLFVPAVTMIGGGITGSTAGLSWGFLVPAYAIMALGPDRATPWYVAFVVMLAGLGVVDPFVHAAIGASPYALQLSTQLINAFVPLTIVFVLIRYLDVRRRAAERRVDELLTNALPATIAARLRRGEHRIAEAYPETTVLFADIVESTPWERQTDPAIVVALLDRLFTRFDALAAECGVEKIKTVGDAYMAAAGAPRPLDDHAGAATRLALGILAAVEAEGASSGLALRVRIGLASGPVVGGVIGSQRAAFDLWGDTVNLASRMESTGVPGHIQVAASTQALLGTRYEVAARDVDVKGLGPMTAYLIVADGPPPSNDSPG